METPTGNSSKRSINTGRCRRARLVIALSTACIAFISISCSQLQKPAPEPFFAETPPPKAQELRWSNGKLPKSFDPALASAAPETDMVRALYEGLTEIDPTTLREVPAVAESWSSSEANKVWTFKLRRNAKWSNGKPVTSHDFVRAWKRLVQLGDKTAHRNLLSNIAGVPRANNERQVENESADKLLPSNPNVDQVAPSAPTQRLSQIPENNEAKPQSNSNTSTPAAGGTVANTAPQGFTAEDDLTLKVTLVLPDKDFPRLVAHPIFRPIFSNGEEFMGKELNPTFVSNGPFRLIKIEPSGLSLVRSDTYWDKESVRLEKVQIVPTESPEKALSAYREGALDAITNADFSPLVLKLLSPYEDFRRTTHSALNFYEVNISKAPFSDRRVREALSNAIDRDRLTEGEMDDSTRPALSFLPYVGSAKAKLTQDKEKAKELLAEAGFPDGEGFPAIKLLVNRNDTQQKIARSVARMWKQNLNVDTEIVVKDATELDRARKVGDFDLVRRGVVFPTSDEAANFMAVFDPLLPPLPLPGIAPNDFNRPTGPTDGAREGLPSPSPTGPGTTDTALLPIFTEDEAIYELRAIPLYFPTSYSLVKPYVAGFEMNSLDILDLADVTIDSDWRPKQ